jgi:DNA repair exonuclease SbcCD nuclease subunit
MASFAFIGDSHLGYRHRSKLQRLRDFARSFEEAVDKAMRLKPDAVVFTGDLIHHPRPDPVSLRTVLRTLLGVARTTPAVVCIGNHEIEGHLGTTYSPIYGDIHENIHVLTSENPHKVLHIRGRDYGFHGFEYTRSREAAQQKLKAVSAEADSQTNILCLHQAVEKYLSPFEISLSSLRQAAQYYDLIVFGHVHKHQRIREVSDVAPAYYCGSTERTSFNEAGNVNGFMHFEDDDFRSPRYVKVDSQPMAYVREEFYGVPQELNRRIEHILRTHREPLLKVDISCDLDGDFLDVRRDWPADERTILDVNVSQKPQETEIHMERASLTEDSILEYFDKTGNSDAELRDLCVELFRRYAG